MKLEGLFFEPEKNKDGDIKHGEDCINIGFANILLVLFYMAIFVLLLASIAQG